MKISASNEKLGQPSGSYVNQSSSTGKWETKMPYGAMEVVSDGLSEFTLGSGCILTNACLAGVGKTVLSCVVKFHLSGLRADCQHRSVVIDFLEQDLPIPHIGLAFIYCNHKEYQSQNLEYLLRAIIRQLVEQRMSIPENICSLYSQHRGKRTAATKEECLWMLQSLSKDSTEVYVVIDALDECIDKENRHFWSDLLEQLRESVAHIRLLCTSRDIEDSKGILQDASRLEIRAKDADIEIYICERVRSHDKLVTFCRQDPDLQGKVVQEVRSKSDGM